MPTSGFATPKHSRSVERLASLHPAILCFILGTVYAGLDLARHGPLWQWLRESVFLPAHVSATVQGSFITRSEVDLAVDLSRAAGGPVTEAAVLDSLVQSELIRQAAAKSGITPPADWVQRAIDTFESGFPPGKLPGLLQAESLSSRTYRDILTYHLTQIHWLDQQAGAPSTDAENWVRTQAAAFADPEVVRARHIFLSTVETDTPEREALIRDIHRKLAEQEDTFAHLAAQFSEDERSKKAGGDLGFFSRQRIPADFAKPVFALSAGQVSQPFRTSIGWHIVEITERIAARPPQWPDLRREVEFHLRNEAKRDLLDAWWEDFSHSIARK
jgi:parvulin-like peptidyl-prolyl isomerase